MRELPTRLFALLAAVTPLLVPTTATAADPEAPVKIAIMGLKAPGFNAATVENLYGILVAEIDSMPQYKVVARDEIEALLGLEQQKSMLGCDDTSCLAEIAGALGVDKVIAGKVGKVGSTFVVNLTLIDHKTASVENRLVRTVRGKEDMLIEAVAQLGRELVGAEGVSSVMTSSSTQTDGEPNADQAGGEFPVLPVVALAAGGVGLIAGAGLLGLSALRYDAYQQSQDTAEARALQEEIPIWWISGGVAGGVGLVAAAAGAVLLVLSE